MITDLNTLRQIADAYLAKWHQNADREAAAPGYVIINRQEEAVGWVAHLDQPQGWEPRCLALAVDRDALYCATGGNPYDGATAWTLIPLDSTETMHKTVPQAR